MNYDQTIRPTLLLHLGAGYLQTYNPGLIPSSVQFNQSSLGLTGYFDPSLFPNLTGAINGITGGVSMNIGPGPYSAQRLWEQKPTANAGLTWVKQNHSFKFGSELTIDGMPEISNARANGNFGVSAVETADPFQNTITGLAGSSGFAYASFFLGQIDNLTISPPTQTKLGNHSVGFYAQDNWKVSRKLTIDYGLRYDFQTYLREQYGRMQDASFNTLNTTVNLPGAVLYEGYGPGRCDCEFARNYPYAFGPRVGIAYQVTPKTVLRAGAGVNYGTTSNNAYLSYSVADFYTFNGPAYGFPYITNLGAGNPQPGLTWPNFNESKYPTAGACPAAQPAPNSVCYTPQSPFIYIDPNARPPRIFQWSIGLQRELQRDILVEANYVGNRGARFTAPNLDAQAWDAINITTLPQLGIKTLSDQSMLNLPLNNPSVVQRGYKVPYAGFPITEPWSRRSVLTRNGPAPRLSLVPRLAIPGTTHYRRRSRSAIRITCKCRPR